MSPYQTHQPLLFACARIARDAGCDVVELGCGLHSTPQLDAMCGGRFWSYETDVRWADCLIGLVRGLRHVASYDDVPLTPGAMVFVDNDPGPRRRVDVERFAGVARLVVVHDTDEKYGCLYGLERSLALYPHRFDYRPMSPNTTAVSDDAEIIRRVRECFR